VKYDELLTQGLFEKQEVLFTHKLLQLMISQENLLKLPARKPELSWESSSATWR
jgi:hypothetical protein